MVLILTSIVCSLRRMAYALRGWSIRENPASRSNRVGNSPPRLRSSTTAGKRHPFVHHGSLCIERSRGALLIGGSFWGPPHPHRFMQLALVDTPAVDAPLARHFTVCSRVSALFQSTPKVGMDRSNHQIGIGPSDRADGYNATR